MVDRGRAWYDENGRAIGMAGVNVDITDRKLAEEALRESEERVRLKLESILAPEGDIGNLQLGDIIDAPALQAMMEEFHKFARIPLAVIDLEGRVLVGVGWQDICTKFHRVNPESCKHCIESDVELSAGVPPGQYRLYHCKNNMWDVATPITVGGKHVGNVFTGQFFFEGENPNVAMFRAQARRYGFDETAYLAELDRVPRLSREALAAAMAYFMKLADMISKLSYSNIKLARSLAERDVLTDSLRSNQARLRMALDAAKSGTWEWDIQTNKNTWSDEVWELYGLEPYSCEPSYETWLATVLPPDRERAQRVVAEAVLAGTELNLEHRVLDADGKTRWLMARGRPVCDANGRPVRFVGIVMDINERKQTEAALLKNEKLASVGRMATTIAHEINNPLAAVTNTVFVASHRAETPPSVRQDLEVVDAELRRIAQITRQALGFYRESSSPQPVSLKSIVESTVDLLASRIKAKCAIVERHCRDDCRVTAVGGELRQVLANLLANSLDAIGQYGTVKLRVSTLRSLNGHRLVRITVADNGNGIEPRVLPHIFEPFFTTKDSVGTGLGLWVTRQIVDKHRGSIRVRSTTAGPHRGTVFSIFLPAEPAPLAARAKAAALSS
jgi:PAS domain S-box-containing protein